MAGGCEDIDRAEGDVVVVGSSSVGGVARVFLGSRATKVVRHLPAPVVVVPRVAVKELAHHATQTWQQCDPEGP